MPGQHILMLAGMGHNGDDVRAAVTACRERNENELKRVHFSFSLCELWDPCGDLPRLIEALALKPDWIVDGLFGIGLNRSLSTEWCDVIHRVNAGCRRIIAVDVPSGFNADAGSDWGAVVQAEITLAVGAPKLGMLGARSVGRIEVLANVGLAEPPPPCDLVFASESDFDNFPGRRELFAHKGDFGHLAIVAGSMGYHGAAVLAARGAMRARPGLISLHAHADVYLPVASQLQQVMVHSWITNLTELGKVSAWVIGPGLAEKAVRAHLEPWLRKLWRESPLPLVVDASALDWLESGDLLTAGIRVVTPHPGEAARLLGQSTSDIGRDRPMAVRQVSARLGGCWVVLKGQQTLIGRERGVIWVNSTGNSDLAQGGSGDILAGYLGGLLAQPGIATTPEKAVAFAVWRHGRAGDELSRVRTGWTVEELPSAL